MANIFGNFPLGGEGVPPNSAKLFLSKKIRCALYSDVLKYYVKIDISNLKEWSNMSLNDIKSYLKAYFELSLLCYFSF